MDIQVTHRTDTIVIVNLIGRFDAASGPEAESIFRKLIEDGAARIVVGMEAVDYISSGGLRVLVMAAKLTERAGGALALYGLTPFVKEVFQVTNLSHLFTVRSTESDAVAAVAG